MRVNKLTKIFGVGPLGMLLSVLLLGAVWLVHGWLGRPPMTQYQGLMTWLFGLSVGLGLGLIAWSMVILPPGQRGNELCTSGPFRYVRHPLYAGFISLMTFGLALHLNGYVYLVWAVALHPLWHYLIKTEEDLAREVFGQQYAQYASRTGRFFPRLLPAKD
ncbi:MAG: isoprenylcysteine carboxylmethyltransferase family protein [Desulfarculus sp.]|nr:isoprenylcysteine carboxylmethyltransferase family protein [Desulfarculus sp.]